MDGGLARDEAGVLEEPAVDEMAQLEELKRMLEAAEEAARAAQRKRRALVLQAAEVLHGMGEDATVEEVREGLQAREAEIRQQRGA